MGSNLTQYTNVYFSYYCLLIGVVAKGQLPSVGDGGKCSADTERQVPHDSGFRMMSQQAFRVVEQWNPIILHAFAPYYEL